MIHLSVCFIQVVVCLFMMPRVGKSLSTGTASKRLNVHWFRMGDLRLHDNPALCESAASSNGLLPIFCFDPRIFGNEARSSFGSLKCAPRRAKFVLESVADLRAQLEKKGSGLVVAQGKPEDVFDSLFASMHHPSVVCQEEVCSEELIVDKAVKSVLNRKNGSLRKVWGSTLYNIKDLPFPGEEAGMPNTFTPFRNKVEKSCTIDKPLPIPSNLSLPQDLELPTLEKCSLTFMPTLKDLGYTPEQCQEANTVDPRGVMEFKGGETAALNRVQDYIWDKDFLKVYFDTRNGMIGADYSTKFAPWLAHGCVSPRFIAKECRSYEETRVANKSTYWVVFELLWRDFFKFFAKKHGNSLFFQGGTVGSDKKWAHFEKSIQAWKEGRTGYPLVDANMRELAATGFMSNRGRQNVCSFLAIDLNQDWRYGADYFESTLLDYDVHSNWGNWCAGAGMTGGRLNRFNIVKQSKDYDCHGEYVRLWLPELKDVPNEFVHTPWKMTQFQQMEYNVRLGVDYPNPIIPPFTPNARNSKGENNRRGGKSDRNNPNRGRGQRKDMKSLKVGNFQMN